MTERTRNTGFMTGIQQDQLEQLVDACGLNGVLAGLANICCAKSDHTLVNWQDRQLANAWMRAMTAIDQFTDDSRIEEVSR